MPGGNKYCYAHELELSGIENHQPVKGLSPEFHCDENGDFVM